MQNSLLLLMYCNSAAGNLRKCVTDIWCLACRSIRTSSLVASHKDRSYAAHGVQQRSLLSIHRLVTFDMQVYQNWTKDVTHLIAAHKDYKFAAHVKQQRDVVCLDWLLECQQTKERTAIKPHHYLHLSKKTLQEVPNVCKFGDM